MAKMQEYKDVVMTKQDKQNPFLPLRIQLLIRGSQG